MRWLFFIPVILIWASSAILSINSFFYMIVFILLTTGLILGSLELRAQKARKHIPLMGLPAYFVAMLLASILAFANFLKGKNFGVWNTARD